MASLRPLLAAALGCGATVPGLAADPSAWLAEAQAAMAAGAYAPAHDGVGLRAANPAQDLRATFGDAGLAVRSPTGDAVGISLVAWGRPGALATAETVPPELGACQSDGAVDALGVCLPRIHYGRPGLTEWWENRPEGLEHGFTVTSSPGGHGPLVFELAIAGALVEGAQGEVLLRRETGDLLRYGSLVAWDEGGRNLPAWMEPTEHGLRLVVDDAGAVGTVTVDPLLNLAWTAESNKVNPYFGVSVASAGDVNGDGYDDVVVGASYYDNGEIDEGRAFLYLGSAAGLAITAAWTAESDQASALFGNSVASAGDVNADGYDDVVVGAYAYTNGQVAEGRASVYLGSAAGLDSAVTWTAEGDQLSAYFGISVAAAGDVNGDTYDDVLVGASGYDNGQADEGRAFLYLGTAAGLESTAAWTTESNQAGAYFGDSVASAGDVNGDDYADVVVGAYGYSNGQLSEGRAHVYLGSAAGLSLTPGWTAESDQIGAYFATPVASAGDVDGDGYDDVIVGSFGYDNGQAGEGRAFLYYGSVAGPEATAGWTVESDQGDAYLGNSVAAAGDVNGDGFDDVVVGAFYFDNGQLDEGRANLYLGSPAGLATTTGWTAESNQAAAYFGRSVAAAGDVNGDGFGDVVVGATHYDSGQVDEGRAYLFHGSCDTDGDGACDDVDPCPVDPLDDLDGDGFCEGVDVCPGGDDALDDDADAVPDDCDRCPGADDAPDADGDAVPDACDACPGGDNGDDADGDDVPDACDTCPGFDDALDGDSDGVPDDCDACPGFNDAPDDDSDGVPDDCDACPGFNDARDDDGDATPNDCDPCPIAPLDDSDADGSCDNADQCPGFDDGADADADSVPDDCDPCPLDLLDDSDGDGWCDSDDVCPGFDDALDADGDAVPDNCDLCPLDSLDDSDSDGSCDSVDRCPAFDDSRDADLDTVPDDCDACPVDPLDDSDGDGSCDSVDRCPAFDDGADADADTVPDDCDPCPLDPLDDSDGDTVCDGVDVCPGSDDASDADSDGIPDDCDPCDEGTDDACTPPAGEPTEKESSGCGCNHGSSAGSAWLVGLLLLASRRRLGSPAGLPRS